MPNDFTATLSKGFELDPEHDIRNVHGAPGWFELLTADTEGAATFLGAVFGWEFRELPEEEAGPGYREILVQGHHVGGIRPPGPGEPEGPFWHTYVTVEDVDRVAERAVTAGGEVVVPPMPLGQAGRMTLVAHRDGGRLLAFEYRRPFS